MKRVLKVLLAVFLSILAFVLIFLGLIFFYKPTPEIAWIKTFGTEADDFVFSLSVNNKGNIYAVGSSSGKFVENSGYRDALVLGLNPSGNKLWAGQFGTSSWDEAYAIAHSGDNYIAGYTFGGFGGNINYGKYDIFITRLALDGNRLWTKQIGTKEDDYAYSLGADRKGNIYIGGYTYGSLEGSNLGGADAFLIKMDPEGNVLWQKQFGSPSDDIVYSIAVDNSDNIYLSGYTGGSLDGNKYSGGWDAFLAKFDPDGKKLWLNQIGTSSWDEAWAVAVDSEGNPYVAGYTGGELGGSQHGAMDSFIAKYDPSGNQKFIKQFGTLGNDYLRSAVISGKDICLSGYTDGAFSGYKNSGSDDIFVTCFSSKGARLWLRQFGSQKGDYAFGIGADTAGNIYIGGETSGSFGGSANKGEYDLFVAKLTPQDTSFVGRAGLLIKEIIKKIGL